VTAHDLGRDPIVVLVIDDNLDHRMLMFDQPERSGLTARLAARPEGARRPRAATR
jgi:hypothetical protein